MLKVTPQITAANTVIMKITIENATPDFSREVNGIPPIDTQRANTQVQVNDGATTVIGGIFVSRGAAVERPDAGAAPRAAPRLAVQARHDVDDEPRAADLHHAAHSEGLGHMEPEHDSNMTFGRKRRVGLRRRAGGAVLLPRRLRRAATWQREGTGSAFLIVDALEAAPGAEPDEVRRHPALRRAHRRGRRADGLQRHRPGRRCRWR